MKIAFYRADHASTRLHKITAWLIDKWTGSHGYSHVELVFSDGQCFSSSYPDGGCRFKQINVNSGRWVVIDLDRQVHHLNETQARVRAQKLVDSQCKYDVRGILFYQIFNWKTQDKNRWWCDEAVAWACGIQPFRNNPNKLAKMLGVPAAKTIQNSIGEP
jgi:hypothetical protein